MLFPTTILCEAGAAETEKSETTNVTVALWTTLPLVPVIVSVYEPLAVLPEVATVRVELPVPTTEAGLKVAVAPAGKPDTVQSMTPLKPLNAVAVAV